MSRCYACSQENCSRQTPDCQCACHDREVREVGKYDDNWSAIAKSAFSAAARDEAEKLKNAKCAEHPRYQAKRKPRLPCEACWRYFVRLNP